MTAELTGALAAEDAAIYAYGVLGVHLRRGAEQQRARTVEQEHRGRRDDLVDRLARAGASAPPTPAGYRLPFPVGDRAAALRLAVHVEDGVAQAWRAVLPTAVGDARAGALSALTDSAVRATRWRRLAQVNPLTMPFPGRAG